MFGKPFAEYVRFVKPALVVIAAVWAVRLGLSLAGVSPSVGRYASITTVVLAAMVYYGWAVHAKGFGSFKQLYPVNLVLGVSSQTLVALAIVLAMVMGQDNIYTIPEFYPPSQGGTPMPPDGKNLVHAAAHIVLAGAIVMPLLGWLVGSLVLFVTRKASAARA
jgi:hypothetical protein